MNARGIALGVRISYLKDNKGWPVWWEQSEHTWGSQRQGERADTTDGNDRLFCDTQRTFVWILGRRYGSGSLVYRCGSPPELHYTSAGPTPGAGTASQPDRAGQALPLPFIWGHIFFFWLRQHFCFDYLLPSVLPFSRGWGWYSAGSWGSCSSAWPSAWWETPCRAGRLSGTFPSWSWVRPLRTWPAHCCPLLTPGPLPQFCPLEGTKEQSLCFSAQFTEGGFEVSNVLHTFVTSAVRSLDEQSRMLWNAFRALYSYRHAVICRRTSSGRAWVWPRAPVWQVFLQVCTGMTSDLTVILTRTFINGQSDDNIKCHTMWLPSFCKV